MVDCENEFFRGLKKNVIFFFEFSHSPKKTKMLSIVKKRKHPSEISIHSIDFLHDLIFDFMERDLKTFVVFAHVQKSWSLPRFAHLLEPVISSKHLEPISKLKNLKFLEVNFDSNDKGKLNHFLYKLTSLRCLLMNAAYELDLTCFQYCKELSMSNSNSIILPQNVEDLGLFGVTSNFDFTVTPFIRTLALLEDDGVLEKSIKTLSLYPNLDSLTLIEGDYANGEPIILDISVLKNCPCLYDLTCREFTSPITGLQYCQNIQYLTICLKFVNEEEISQLKILKKLCLEEWDNSQNLVFLHDLPQLKKIVFRNPKDDVTKCLLYPKFQEMIEIKQDLSFKNQ
jgi:hypothetical protein